MKTYVEIEAKYDVADGQELPDLIGVGGVEAMVAQAEMVLTATYFDTPGQALSAAKATLRRRTGGTDDGWHLKLPLADGERLELRRALGRGQSPPAALTGLVRSIVRAEPLEVVATLVNRRTVHQLLDGEGRLLAELADDSVTGERHDVAAEPMSWRELEIELVEGDRGVLVALDAAVRAAGVAPASGPSKLARVLGTQASRGSAGAPFGRKTAVGEVLAAGLRQAALELRSADPLVALDRPTALPRLATAIRRVRAALALQDEVEHDELVVAADAELGWLQAEVSRVTEIDAARERIRSALSGQPAELVMGPVVRRVDRELAAARRTELAALREVLDAPRYLALLDSLAQLEPRALAAAGAGRRVRDVLPPLVERDVQRAERKLSKLRRDTPHTEQGQRLRAALRAVERARHTELLAAGTKGWGRGGLPEVLGDVSELLVELEESRSTQVRLRLLAQQAQAAGESGFTFGRLHGLEELAAALLLRKVAKLRKRIRVLDQE